MLKTQYIRFSREKVTVGLSPLAYFCTTAPAQVTGLAVCIAFGILNCFYARKSV